MALFQEGPETCPGDCEICAVDVKKCQLPVAYTERRYIFKDLLELLDGEFPEQFTDVIEAVRVDPTLQEFPELLDKAFELSSDMYWAYAEPLVTMFERIRDTYFPELSHEWTLCYFDREEAGYLDPRDACCNPRTKSILIRSDIDSEFNDTEIEGVFIHEMAHAMTPGEHHGTVWERHVKDAAVKADSLGQTKLAKVLRDRFCWHTEE